MVISMMYIVCDVQITSYEHIHKKIVATDGEKFLSGFRAISLNIINWTNEVQNPVGFSLSFRPYFIVSCTVSFHLKLT